MNLWSRFWSRGWRWINICVLMDPTPRPDVSLWSSPGWSSLFSFDPSVASAPSSPWSSRRNVRAQDGGERPAIKFSFNIKQLELNNIEKCKVIFLWFPTDFRHRCFVLLVTDVFEFPHLAVVTLLGQTAESLRQLEETQTVTPCSCLVTG